MRPCLNLTTLLRADLEQALAAAAEGGFNMVELWADSLERYLDSHSIEDLCSLLELYRMGVLSIGDIESITFCNAEQFDELTRRCKRLASVAHAISCPTLVVSASVRPRGVADSEIAEETESVLEKLLDIVEAEGTGLAMAFRGFSWCAINSLEGAVSAVDAHSDRRAGLVLDTFDLHSTGVRPETLRTIETSRISVLRLSDCIDVPSAILSESDRTLPGEGIADLDAMLQTFSDMGFSGPVSMKILSPKLWGLEASEIAKIVMAVAEKYLPGKPREGAC